MWAGPSNEPAFLKHLLWPDSSSKCQAQRQQILWTFDVLGHEIWLRRQSRGCISKQQIDEASCRHRVVVLFEIRHLLRRAIFPHPIWQRGRRKSSFSRRSTGEIHLERANGTFRHSYILFPASFTGLIISLVKRVSSPLNHVCFGHSTISVLILSHRLEWRDVNSYVYYA